MALDTATKRASLIPSMLPFASGTVGQEERQAFIPSLFASPLSTESLTWTVQGDAVTSWSLQSDVSTTWAIQV